MGGPTFPRDKNVGDEKNNEQMYIVFLGNYSIHISTCTVIDTFSDFRGNYRYMYL